MNNTFQILLNWDKGQPFAERMAAKLLTLDEYSDIDPQCPVGGPDGTKDIICSKGGKVFVVACYFPCGQKNWGSTRKKFSDDYKGVKKNNADGFIFITNQKITPENRRSLSTSFPASEIFHGERVCGYLDSPKGYGIRLEYLGIELTKAEQISFLNAHLDLKARFDEITLMLREIKSISPNSDKNQENRRSYANADPSTPPMAGVPLSSRISVEDLRALHLACMYESNSPSLAISQGYRRVRVMISGADIDGPGYMLPSPDEIPRKVNELLEWWRKEYMNVIYSDEGPKIAAIAIFHEKLLSIHPFLDGNGRLARVIASIQFRDLLNLEFIFDEIENRDAYVNALMAARKDECQSLIDFFRSIVKQAQGGAS